MCTITFLPLSDNQFIITSNRDESIFRPPALFPTFQKIGNYSVFFPKDLQAGGTWIAAAENKRIVCLMNGAFKPYLSSPLYRKSRGLILLDNFLFDCANQFI